MSKDPEKDDETDQNATPPVAEISRADPWLGLKTTPGWKGLSAGSRHDEVPPAEEDLTRPDA